MPPEIRALESRVNGRVLTDAAPITIQRRGSVGGRVASMIIK
jgi:hypothetical protein